MKLKNALLVGIGLALCSGALAQQYDQPNPTSTFNMGGVFNTTLPTITNGKTGYVQIDSVGRIITTPGSGTFAAQTSITATFSGADTTTATATLPAAAGKLTYICGFNISGLGATAATTVSPTIATLAGGNTFTLSGGYTFAAGATVNNTLASFTFPLCVAANAVNSTIVVTVPGAAGNTSTFINAWGYQQ